MVERFPEKFLSLSKQLMEKEPQLKKKLDRVMGRVADRLVKEKYLNSERCPENSDESKGR